MSKPQLLPIFRTPSQGLILSHLLALDAGPLSLTQLSERTGIPLSTVQREITALERATLVRTSRVGNVRLATADTESPYFEDLRSLLLKAYGPATVLADALDGVSGVDAAYIFGSWARRYRGETGPAANDVDLLVVGEVDPREVYAAVRGAEQTLSLDVNPVIVSAGEWAQPEGFVARVKDGSLVQIAGDAPA